MGSGPFHLELPSENEPARGGRAGSMHPAANVWKTCHSVGSSSRPYPHVGVPRFMGSRLSLSALLSEDEPSWAANIEHRTPNTERRIGESRVLRR